MKRWISPVEVLAALVVIILISFTIRSVDVAAAKRNHHEKWYQDLWVTAHGGRAEVVLKSGARCDILTNTHAVEVDFADKWAEGLGQAQHYASQTGKRAAVLLIMENGRDIRYLNRLRSTRDYFKLPVDIWVYKAY